MLPWHKGITLEERIQDTMILEYVQMLLMSTADPRLCWRAYIHQDQNREGRGDFAL